VSWSSVTSALVPPFLQARLIPNFNNSGERQHLLLEPGQFEDILRFVRTNLRVWFYISGLGTNYLSAARHKMKRHHVGGLLCYRFQHDMGKSQPTNYTGIQTFVQYSCLKSTLFSTSSRKTPVFYGTLVLWPRAEQLTNNPCLYTHESGTHLHILFL
jgi:hypothetical protein